MCASKLDALWGCDLCHSTVVPLTSFLVLPTASFSAFLIPICVSSPTEVCRGHNSSAQYSTVHYSVAQYSTVEQGTVLPSFSAFLIPICVSTPTEGCRGHNRSAHNSSVQYSTVLYITVQHNTVQ